jgi:hypothetical protein
MLMFLLTLVLGALLWVATTGRIDVAVTGAALMFVGGAFVVSVSS